MSAKKKKQSNSPLRVIIILVLLGLLAYKHQLFDGKLLENILTVDDKTHDILLDSVPWGFRQIRLPWLKKYIQVKWHDKQEF